MVHEAWDKFLAADPMGNVLLKVSNCQTHLSEWNKKVFGNVQRTLEKKRKELEQAGTTDNPLDKLGQALFTKKGRGYWLQRVE